MQASTRIKVIAVIAVIAGPFLTYNGHRDKERLARLEKEGITVDGLIEGGESRKRKRSSSYTLDVAYTPQGGTSVRQSFKVTSPFFSAHTNGTAITDPAVKVRYVAAEVQDSAIIVGGSTDDTALFPVGIGAFVLGLGTLGLMTMRKS